MLLYMQIFYTTWIPMLSPWDHFVLREEV